MCVLLWVGNQGRYASLVVTCNSFEVFIRPKCITILYSNSFLFIDIFHVMMLFLCCFGLFYTVCNFPMPKEQKQDSTVKSGRRVAELEDLQITWKLTETFFQKNDGDTESGDQRGPAGAQAPPWCGPTPGGAEWPPGPLVPTQAPPSGSCYACLHHSSWKRPPLTFR